MLTLVFGLCIISNDFVNVILCCGFMNSQFFFNCYILGSEIET